MAGRIVLTMLALVSALLITAVAPLGLLTTGREQATFRMETVSADPQVYWVPFLG